MKKGGQLKFENLTRQEQEYKQRIGFIPIMKASTFASSRYANDRLISFGSEIRRRKLIFSLQHLKHTRRPHPRADTHGDHPVFLLVSAQTVQQRCGTNCPRCTEWMTQCNCAAQRIDLGRI